MALERDTILHRRYRVVEILGQGGMGSVYRAIDENLGVSVALKENLFTTEEYARQFRLEAVILANLRHPNLPRVSDHFVVGEQGQYLVMDFIEGEDLRQRMERTGTIGEDDAVQIGAAMCDALGYLHSRKPPILHRDLKPGNVKITPDGHIFLVDFGLAKLVQAGQATTSGARAMTPGYSPPEQYGGARTDPRSDIYSLGATLYAALSGNIPEDGLARAMDNAQLTPLRKRNPRISRRLAAAIEKAMAVDPSDRFQLADDFKKALLNSKSKTVQLGGAYAVSAPPQVVESGSPDAAVNKEARPSAPLSISPGPDDQPPFVSPQKKQLEKQRRRVRNLRRTVLGALVVTVALIAVTAPAVIPASLRLLAAGVKMASLSGSTATAPAATEAAPALVESTRSSTATLASTATLSTPTPTRTVQPPTATAVTLAMPVVTPVGGGAGEIAFASSREGDPQIYLMDLPGINVRQLTDLPQGACQPAWSPDGARLIFASPCGGTDEVLYQARLHIVNADGSGLEEIAASEPGDFEPAWSPDGTSVVFTSVRSGATELYMLDLNGGSVRQLTYGSFDLQSRQPAWSPDGRRIAYTVKRFGTVFQVWLMDASGGNQAQLVRSGIRYSDYLPSWSPDGRFVLFNHRRADTPSLPYLMLIAAEDAVDEQGEPLELNIFPIEDASYSTDGYWILYEGEVEQQDRDILLVNGTADEKLRLTSTAGLDFDPAWRPATLP